MTIHVEDPGAANWVLPLLPALRAKGATFDLLADGSAVDYLKARGVTEFSSAPGRADFVLVGTSENLVSRGLSLIDDARARGVPCAALVDQPSNAEHRFRGDSDDPLRHFPDWIFVSDGRTAGKFRQIGVSDDRCVVVGNPNHDRVLSKAHALASEDKGALRRLLLPGAPDDRRVVVFVSEVGYVVNPQAGEWEAAGSFSGRGGTSFRTAVILEEVLDACRGLTPRPFFVLRLHPKNSRDEFAAYSGEIDFVSSAEDPLALVYAADLTIGMTTSLLEEAAVLGRPTLAVIPRPEEREWLGMVADGRIPSVGTRKELRNLLPQVLQARSASELPSTAGAADRIVDHILSVAAL